MPEHIIDCTITKVYEGPNGEGEWGPWQAYNFYLDKGDKKKFGFMWSGKKPKPVKGMKIKHLEYEVEEDGQFTNYKVKTLEVADKIEPQAIPNAKEDQGPIPQAKNDREVSFYVSYAKDVAIALIQSGIATRELLQETCRDIAKAGIVMMNESLNNVQIPSKDEPEPIPQAKTKSTKGKGGPSNGPSKVVCDYEDAPWWGQERITMFCKNQCQFKDICATAKQLREAE